MASVQLDEIAVTLEPVGSLDLDDSAKLTVSPGRAAMLEVDVPRRTDPERLVANPIERFGRLEVFVSNAGIARTGLVADLDDEEWEAMIDVNLRGVLYGVAAGLRCFAASASGISWRRCRRRA